jgi:molybdate transport system ATP-binding protein
LSSAAGLSQEALRAEHLRVRMRHRQGALELDLAFALRQPWTVLFGPSGSGKTTVLRAIAGLMRPDEGTIVYGAEARTLLDSGAGVFVPAHERPVRTAAQSPRLFPHMSVAKNLRYGCGGQGEQAEIVNEAQSLFRLDALAGRMPHELSGGELQRVSVARAAVSAVTFSGFGKALLLLDEPFNGMDMRLRDELVVEMQAWLNRWEIPVLLVTHDVGEAFQLGAEVIKIADGRVVRQGACEMVLSEERERLLGQLSRNAAAER